MCRIRSGCDISHFQIKLVCFLLNVIKAKSNNFLTFGEFSYRCRTLFSQTFFFL